MSKESFLVWCPDYGQTESDAWRIEAGDAGDAAEEWAELDDCDSAEYSIVSGKDQTVTVKSCADGSVTSWRVRGEAQPVYYAHEVKEVKP